jgi:hypothetical protein
MRMTSWKGEGVEAALNISGFDQHIRACNNADLPGERLPFHLAGQPVGWVPPDVVAVIGAAPSVRRAGGRVYLDDPAAMPDLVARLAAQGLCKLRGEQFDIRANPDAPSLGVIDRGALPQFGIQAIGVHVNGLVRRSDGLHVWVARRSADKQLDPGKLDHMVAGGVPAGLGAMETLIKEAAEEAAVPQAMAAGARAVGRIGYALVRPEGLRRDLLLCYDLELPEDFQPMPVDGEVAGFELWPVERVLQTVRDTDDFKFNVNLVLIDLFLRLGLIGGPAGAALRRALEGC